MGTKKIAEIIIEAFKSGNHLYIIGNGGSATMASHFVGELQGKYKQDRQPLPAISLFDLATMTAIANDTSYKYIFSRPLEALGKRKDVLIALSTSGESKNVLEAIRVAKRKGIKVIKFPTNDELGLTTDKTQERHLNMIHKLSNTIERAFI